MQLIRVLICIHVYIWVVNTELNFRMYIWLLGMPRKAKLNASNIIY